MMAIMKSISHLALSCGGVFIVNEARWENVSVAGVHVDHQHSNCNLSFKIQGGSMRTASGLIVESALICSLAHVFALLLMMI